MFYCNKCGKERNWPTDTFIISIGTCEICGKKEKCNNVPSKQLPISKEGQEKNTTKVIMDIAGIDNLVIVSVPDNTDKEEAREMAIETVCMIKKTDINIKKII